MKVRVDVTIGDPPFDRFFDILNWLAKVLSLFDPDASYLVTEILPKAVKSSSSICKCGE